MFQTSGKRSVPNGPIEKIEAFPGSLGGYVVVVTVDGVAHYAAFEEQLQMTQYLLVLLNREQMDKARADVKAKKPAKRGRPKGSKNKPKVANGVDGAHAHVPAEEVQAAA